MIQQSRSLVCIQGNWNKGLQPMFIAVLFGIAKIGRQRKCPLMDEWVKNMCGRYIQWNIFHRKKKGNPAIFDNTGELGGQYAKWHKPDREWPKLYGITYMQSSFLSHSHWGTDIWP